MSGINGLETRNEDNSIIADNKTDVIRRILTNYNHDWEEEGKIGKRRIWYILKPQFRKLPLFIVDGKRKINNDTAEFWDIVEREEEARRKPKIFFQDMISKNTGKPTKEVDSKDLNDVFNKMAKEGLIDDSYILDNSRDVEVGRLLPNIILATEKMAVGEVASRLAQDLGISYYNARGFSAIYGAKKLSDRIEVGLDFEPYELTEEIFTVDPFFRSGYIPEAERTKTIILSIADWDKGGQLIIKTLSTHFTGDPKYTENHRVILNPEQVPQNKVDDYFKITKDMGKNYQLDILSNKQLRKVFLAHIPQHVADMIIEKNRSDREKTDKEDLIQWAIEKVPEVIEIQDDLDEMKEEKDEIEKEFLDKIKEIEKEMEEATEEVDKSIETVEEDLLQIKVDLLPEYLNKFDSDKVLTLHNPTINDIAADNYIPYRIDKDWVNREVA